MAVVSGQPSGTVTLVFTDVEGSTRLLRELGRDAYRDALAAHRRVVREAFVRHAGYEVDYEGDAFFYAFPSASGAVAAVSEAMERLAGGPIRIRVGIHTGQPLLDPPKYVGIDVHLAARVMSVGYGGQVLLSKSTRDLVAVDARDLGEHRLKDLDDPVWLYQVGDGEFPPLRSLNNTNLPTPASSFLGREAELEEADDLLGSCRMLTVSGPGGAGKTRFAIELASRQLPLFPNGAFWVPLVALREPALVLETIGQTLGARDGLVAHIGTRRMLLLLDNFEQVVEAAPELARLLTACANVTLLVTSRELLRVEGEVEFSLPPLAQHEAVALFCERARLDRSAGIEQLCDRLDGLPLAIELAAARMTVYTPEQLLGRLAQRLDLLRGGRDAHARQRTLRATIQWSYDLLEGDEAALLRRLAVFAGGWTLEAAEEMAAASADALQSLVEKSLVRHGSDRFWMLETIREFALEQLEATGEAAAARAGYCGWMLRLAEGAGDALEGVAQQEWLSRLHAEHANLREVLTIALDAGEGELGLWILTALERYWFIRPGEAMAWFDRALELRGRVPPALAADALRVGGTTAWFYGEPQLTLERCREGLAIYRQLGDESGIAKSYSRMGPPLISAGRLEEAAGVLDKAVALHRRLGQEEELALALHISGFLNVQRGDLKTAAELLEASIELDRKLSDLQPVADSLLGLAEISIKTKDFERAAGRAREALEVAWPMRDLIRVGMCFGVLAVALAGLTDEHSAAVFWGAGDRLDAELGQTQWRLDKAEMQDQLSPAVLADVEGLAAGRALDTIKAVELALHG